MAIITLGGIQYISESIEDTSVPAHNYDEVIDISKAEDPDAWFGRVQAEWPSLPPEIKQKVIDSTGEHIGKLTSSIQGDQSTNSSVDPNAPLEEAQKDGNGNEVFDFAEGRSRISKYDDAALEHTFKDLVEVIKIQEESNRQGHNTPKLGYYWDEYWTVVDEIARRQKKGSTFNLAQLEVNGKPIDNKLDQLGN